MDKKTKKYFAIWFTISLVFIAIYIPVKLYGLGSLDPFIFAMSVLGILLFIIGYSIYYFVSSHREENRLMNKMLHDWEVEDSNLNNKKDDK